jgi:hypothetical protein
MKKRTLYLIFASLILVSIIAFVALKDDAESNIVELKASVKYVDKKFIITNKDTVDFVNANLAIDNYFKLRKLNLQIGETYTIWQAEFVHHNGMHYPNGGKPSQFSIWCELYDGKNGFYSQKIK